MFNILVVKETRINETRVALVPSDVFKLIKMGHKLYIEENAGLKAGFSDQDYINVGATIRKVDGFNFTKLFENINVIIRVKRPSLEREQEEYKFIAKNTIMVGALDPLEKYCKHIDNYHKSNIIAYSLDQLKLSPDDPLNLLHPMSVIAGKLAVIDALDKCKHAKKIVIVGFGTVGASAFTEALKHNLEISVVVNNSKNATNLIDQHINVLIINKNEPLELQQLAILNLVRHADIVITCARRAKEQAPILIPKTTLDQMQKNSVVVDMALSEGGNVDGSEHDTTKILGNNVIVTNVSGYPKALPRETSIIWSKVSLNFIKILAVNDNTQILMQARC